MGIFIFPPHAKIPLHDHPGMCVLSRVVYGDLKRISLDLARDGEVGSHSATSARIPHLGRWLRHVSSSEDEDGMDTMPAGGKLAFKNKVDHLHAPACSVLYPYEGNLHEFEAGPNGAAMLDVLLPPYDVDHHRDCTFYEIHHASDNEKPEKHHSHGEPCWIVPTGQPEDFHCISGRYRGLG